MTPEQRRILRPVFSQVAHHNKHLWWELKREIFDRGFQAHYHREFEFSEPARAGLAKLSAIDRQWLVSEWRRVNQDAYASSDEEVLGLYSVIIVEEVVRRATVATQRTENW